MIYKPKSVLGRWASTMKRVKVYLKDGSCVSGRIEEFDNYLNIFLRDAEFEGKWYKWLFVRGASVLYVCRLE